jgi:hypothetical protein
MWLSHELDLIGNRTHYLLCIRFDRLTYFSERNIG